METLRPGDVVRLRCGGPAMVIARRATPSPTIPGVGDLTVFQDGWIVHWQVQGALREATLADCELELVQGEGKE